MGCRRGDRKKRGEERSDGRKRQWQWKQSWWDDVGEADKRDDESGEECEGRGGGLKKGIEAGGWTYKSDGGGDPLWDRMKGKIETDLG